MPDVSLHQNGHATVSEGTLERLKVLRDQYQRQLCTVLACGRSLLISDTWYYDPDRLDGVIEISDHIRRAIIEMKATDREIRAAEKRVGLW